MTQEGFSFQIIESAGVGTISTFIGLALSTVLDKKIGQDKSNMVGLLLESVLDFMGQKFVFEPGKKVTESLAFKFIVAKVFAIIATQVLFMFVVWTAKGKINEITIQFVRLGTAALAFMLITYPLRKYWIFKDAGKKTEHENNTEQHLR